MHRLVKVKVSTPLTAWSHRDKCSHHCHSLLVRAFLLEYCILKPNRERPLNPRNEYVCMHLQLLSINKTGFTYGLKLCILQSAASINTQGDSKPGPRPSKHRAVNSWRWRIHTYLGTSYRPGLNRQMYPWNERMSSQVSSELNGIVKALINIIEVTSQKGFYTLHAPSSKGLLDKVLQSMK